MNWLVRLVAVFFGNPLVAGATAEWCEHDPKVVVVDADGHKVHLHVFVTVRTTNRHLLQDWKKQEDLWITAGPGVVVVTGPECEFRTWAEYRGTKPFTIVGDEFRLYPALDVATITVPMELGR